jgi:hypothetical protein
MQNPRATGAGPAVTGAMELLASGSDISIHHPVHLRHKLRRARARALAEAADLHLQRGQHAVAERLSWLAMETMP